MRSTLRISRLSNNEFKRITRIDVYISREYSFFSGSSLHKGRVLGASKKTFDGLENRCTQGDLGGGGGFEDAGRSGHPYLAPEFRLSEVPCQEAGDEAEGCQGGLGEEDGR